MAILQQEAPTPTTVLPRFRTALTSRVVVEQAKGFLREPWMGPWKFTLLRRYARAHGDHLTEVSRRLMTKPEARAEILAAMSQIAGAPPS